EGSEQLVQQWRTLPDSVLWLDIQDEITPQIRELLRSFDCNELAITDCARTRHPPKVENFDSNSFILYRGISQLDDAQTLVPQQLGIWVGSNYLITVHRGHAVSVEHLQAQVAADKLLKAPS